MSIMDANSVLIERRQMPASGALEYRRYLSTMLAIPMTASATKNSARTSKKNRRSERIVSPKIIFNFSIMAGLWGILKAINLLINTRAHRPESKRR